MTTTFIPAAEAGAGSAAPTSATSPSVRVNAVSRTDQWLDALWAPFWGTRNVRTSSLPERRVVRRGERWACRQGRRKGVTNGRARRIGGARTRVDRGAVRSVRCWGHPTRDRDPAVGGGGLLLSCLSGCRFGSPSMPVSKPRCHFQEAVTFRAGASGRSAATGRSVRRSRRAIGRGRPVPARPGRRVGPPRQKIVGCVRADASTTTGNGRRLPSGLMPPTTYPVARSAAAGSARTAFRPPQASARPFRSSSRSTGTTASTIRSSTTAANVLHTRSGAYVERGSRVRTVCRSGITIAAVALGRAHTCGRDARCRLDAGCRRLWSRRSSARSYRFGLCCEEPHRAHPPAPGDRRPSRSLPVPAAGPHSGALA